MKKLLNISVIAALAVLPFAANAATGDPVAGSPTAASAANPAQAAATVTTNVEPKYALAVEGDNDANLATAGYVKGAYNATIKAVNKVAETAANAANQDLSNLSETGTGVITTAVTNNAAGGTYSNTTSGLTATTIQGAIDEVAGTAGNAADKDLSNLSATGTGVITTAVTNNAAGGTYDNTTSGLTAETIQAAIDEVAGTAGSALQAADIDEGTANGTISVDGTDVAVHGLGSAAFTASTDYISSAAGSVKTANIDDKQVTKAKLEQAVQDSLDLADSALQASDLTDYAKKTGVTQTITNSTISGTVPTVTTWGTETTGTAEITASIVGATYAEPANP